MAVASLSAAGLPVVVVVNPTQVRAFANALGKRTRTDPIDAVVIAHFIEATKPKPRPPPFERSGRAAQPDHWYPSGAGRLAKGGRAAIVR